LTHCPIALTIKIMPLSIGIVGLPNVGKSTLFEALTKKQVDRQNYPFCTIDPNVGVVAVPDKRVDKLAKINNSQKKIYTTVEFVDIAGLVAGAHKGEGLGNQFLANIRETDAIVYVLRLFDNKKITNTQKQINPLDDKEILDTEMILKDLSSLEKIISKLEKQARSGDKQAIKKIAVLSQAKGFLEQDKLLSEITWDKTDQKIIQQYQFLTDKPRLYILNGQAQESNKKITQTFKQNNWPYIIIDVISELESIGLSKKERNELGLSDPQLPHIIKESYDLLDLITFFTSGEQETRAWTIKRGASAPQAGGEIHTDFEKNFIKADVINWQKLVQAGSWTQARSQGLVRTQGKDYIIQDGDVIIIKTNA